MVHLHEDPPPAALRVRGGSGGSGLSYSQPHCTSPVPRPSPLGCARLRPASARLSRPLCPPLPVSLPSIFVRFVSLAKNPGADAPSEAGMGLFASTKWHSTRIFSRAFAREQFCSNADFRPFWCCFWEYHPSGGKAAAKSTIPSTTPRYGSDFERGSKGTQMKGL